MRKILLLAFIVLSNFFCSAYAANFDLVTPSARVTIVYASDDKKLNAIAANLLAQDIERVSGYLPKVLTDISKASGNVIIIGTVQSGLIKSIGKNYAKDLHNQWETYRYTVVKNLNKKIDNALVIAGSDIRGTAYGVFGISEKIGVSPWYWWADVAPVKRPSLSIAIDDFTSKTPSVQYRGIFINDEDWGLQPWAAKTFEPETKDIGPKTYAKVFELLLRLKANLIWPAMHPSTKAFFHYPGNKQVAADYEIVVGSSHAEPMLRNNVDEWNKKWGDFNYVTNKPQVLKYWEARVKESAVNDIMFTMGMRGIHDGKMEGVKTTKEAVPLIETILKDQRNLIGKYVNQDLTKVPQALTVYKEVLDIYEAGLQVPEDITLIWPDDNYGYIHRLANPEESSRSGGTGVYYHASYWGRPHDYLWLSSTHPALIRTEMAKAYEMNARKVWVLNVGDIKPLEYNIEFFLDMAYDVAPFMSSEYSKKHLRDWASAAFDKDNAPAISEILWEYYQLAFERRPEFMGWSGVEPTTPVAFTEYNHHIYGDEAQRRIDRYDLLQRAAADVATKVPEFKRDAFYQLVQYPVTGASLINKKYLYRDKAALYAKEGRLSAQQYYKLANSSHDEIVKETQYFNETLAKGKWNGMMSMRPRDLPVFSPPKLDLAVADHATLFAITPEGAAGSGSASSAGKRVFTLPAFNRYSRSKHFVDVYLTKEARVDYQVSSSADWIKLSDTAGTLSPQGLTSQQRIWVEIDWSKAPSAKSLSGTLTVKSKAVEYTVGLTADNADIAELRNFKGFIESDGYVSMNASSFTRSGKAGDKAWEATEGMGSERKMLESRPYTATVDTTETGILRNPFVEYDFYSFGTSPAVVNVYTLPTFPLNNNYEMRYAVRVDDGPLKVLNFKTVGRTDEWKRNVLTNNAVRSVVIPELRSGKHKLTIYMMDPGVILDKIFISMDGKKLPYSDVQETILR
jgi:hypothetical protein